MRVFAERSARTMILSALALAAGAVGVTPMTVAAVAGSAKPVAARQASLQRASQLVDAGKIVEAKQVLEQLLASGSASDADKSAAAALLQVVETKAKSANPADLSVQKAELALNAGDLRSAERAATAAMQSAQASDANKAAAEGVLATIAQRRSAAQGGLGAMLDEASAMANQGNMAGARAKVEQINMLGLTLSEADQARLDAVQMKVVGAGAPATGGGDVRLVKDEMGAVPAEERTVGTRPALPAAAPAPFFPYEDKTIPAPAASGMGEAPVTLTYAAPAPAVADSSDLMQMALRAEAQRVLAEADQAFDGGRFAEAARRYEMALMSQRAYLSGEDIARAEQRLAECRVRMSAPGGGSLEDSVTRNFNLVREKAQAEYNNDLAEAEKALAAGQADKALASASSAQLSLDRAKTFFSQGEYDGMTASVTDLKRRINARAEDLRVSEAKAREEQARTRSEEVQKNLRAEKDRKVNDGIARIRALQKEQKYAEAMEVCNQVLFLDPSNPSAQLLKELISDVMAFRRAEQLARELRSNIREFKMAGMDATVPPLDIVDYPNDWPKLTMMRTGAGGYYESAENRGTIAALDGRKIRAEFTNQPLGTALAYIGKAAGVEIDPDWRSLSQIGVDPETPVTLNVGDQPAKDVLERVLRKVSKDRFAKADYSINSGVVEVGSADAIRQHTVVLSYPITDLLLVAPDYTDVPEADLTDIVKSKARRAEDNAKGSDPFKTNLGDAGKNEGDRPSRIRNLVSVVQQNIDPDSWKDNGGDIGSINELNGVLVITTTPRNHREITGLLSRLREIRQTQINVETRFLLVSQDFFEQIGFDIDVYFNGQNNQVQALRGFDPNIRPSDLFNFPGNAFVQRTLDSNVYATNPSGGGTPTLTPVIIGGAGGTTGTGTPDRGVQQVPIPQNWSPIATGQNSLGLLRNLVPSNNLFTTSLVSSAPALGIAGQYLDDIQVDFLIRATQADRRTVTLNAPRLTFTNGQIANVVVGTQRAFISDLQPITSEGAVGFDPEADSIADGVTLLIEGVASADRRYVTMNVEAGVSALQELANFPVTATAGSRIVTSDQQTNTISSSLQLPLVSVSRVNTTVTVPDQGTILLGGQRLTTEIEVETGVPVLSKIPIINRFFTNRLESRQDSTLLILIKPTVLVQSEQEERFFPGLNDALRGGN
jgi:type II secretory pathway component GspD/PulD (secretin)/tetratricopeptide (TPR) repeat protein